jgi:hypothetical protein
MSVRLRCYRVIRPASVLGWGWRRNAGLGKLLPVPERLGRYRAMYDGIAFVFAITASTV